MSDTSVFAAAPETAPDPPGLVEMGLPFRSPSDSNKEAVTGTGPPPLPTATSQGAVQREQPQMPTFHLLPRRGSTTDIPRCCWRVCFPVSLCLGAVCGPLLGDTSGSWHPLNYWE